MSTRKKILTQFFLNLRHRWSSVPADIGGVTRFQVRTFQAACKSCITYPAPTWHASKPRLAAVKKLQNDLMMQLCPWKRGTQPWPEYSRIRAEWARRQNATDCWAEWTMGRQVSWYEHIQRHIDCWPAAALEVTRPIDLRSRRSQLANTIAHAQRSVHSGRLDGRVMRGKVHARWGECFEANCPQRAREWPLGQHEPEEHYVSRRVQENTSWWDGLITDWNAFELTKMIFP